jgi:hypothetical protein
MFSFFASTLLAAGSYSRPNTLAAAIGSLVGMGVIIWLLWTSHLFRAFLWIMSVVGALGRLAFVVSRPRFSLDDDLLLVLSGVGALAFLLWIGWLGRTPERSQKVLVVVLCVQFVAMVAVAGFVMANPGQLRVR